MARQLKMAEVTTIRTLHASGHSNREIARLLGVNRDTVGRYVAAQDSEPAKPDHRALPGPANACEAFRELILAKLDQGLEGMRIYQDLRDEHQFTASYSSVRRLPVISISSASCRKRSRIAVPPPRDAHTLY